MNLKKLLTIKMPAISMSTPYWKAFKACSFLLLLPEVALALAVLFHHVSLIEFWQISFGLLLLLPMAPLILRMKSDRAFFVIVSVLLVVIVGLFTLMAMGDRYYAKSVLQSYLQGEDYKGKSDSLSKFASSNASAYTKFLIDEIEFLRRSAHEAKQLEEMAGQSQTEAVRDLRNIIIEHMREMDERFMATGYSNRSSVACFDVIVGKYSHLTNFLNNNFNDR